ncbi:MAG: helix-turn-helix domain-containing protein, partial [Candidatus Eremiobacterota bacterium]
TLNEICVMTGKSYTSVLRYVKSGKLKSVTMTIQGKPCYKVKKSDLERFIEKHGLSMNIHCEDNRISMNNQGISMKETFKEVVRETIAEERNQLMKPIEEQALYRLGILENEVKHLQAEKATLRQENELLREQIKALPGPVELENKENIILLLQKEKEEQTRKTEGLNQVLLDNANNIKELTKEKDNFQSTLKEQEATIREKERALKDLEEIHRVELELAEKKQMEISEAWKKELELAKKPWWKFW